MAIVSHKLPSGNYEIYAGEISAPKEASIRKSGLREGDRILKANGCDINNVYSLVTIVKIALKITVLFQKKQSMQTIQNLKI